LTWRTSPRFTAERGVDLIDPEPRQSAPDAECNRRKLSYAYRGVQPEYEASQFRSDATTNSYVCPQGKRLIYEAKYPQGRHDAVSLPGLESDCDGCAAKPFCCPRSRYGRSVERREPVAAIAAYRDKMQTAAARAICKRARRSPNFRWVFANSACLASTASDWKRVGQNIQQWIRLRRRAQAAAITAEVQRRSHRALARAF
jgi:hypothetical protein